MADSEVNFDVRANQYSNLVIAGHGTRCFDWGPLEEDVLGKYSLLRGSWAS